MNHVYQMSPRPQVVALPQVGAAVDHGVGRTLLRSLRTHGYVYVAHPALSPATLNAVKGAGRTLLTYTPSEERVCAPTSGFRGFHRQQCAGAAEAIRCFSIGREVQCAEEALALRQAFYTSARWTREDMVHAGHSRCNPWPASMSQEREVLATYYRTCSEDVVPSLLDHLASGLVADALDNSADEMVQAALFPNGMASPSLLRDAHSRFDGNLEVKLYPRATNKTVGKDTNAPPSSTGASSESKAEIDRLASHQDLSSVTLLAQDTMGGVEFLDTATGVYEAVPVLEEAVLVNVGLQLERWTQGHIEATPHRVRNLITDAARNDRCSVVHFAFPDFDYELRPLFGGTAPFMAGDLHRTL